MVSLLEAQKMVVNDSIQGMRSRESTEQLKQEVQSYNVFDQIFISKLHI